MSNGWHYELEPRAMRDMERLERSVRQRVFDALDRLIQDPYRGDIIKLSGRRNEWRLRVGDWRVRFNYDRENRSIVVLLVLPRSRAYRD